MDIINPLNDLNASTTNKVEIIDSENVNNTCLSHNLEPELLECSTCGLKFTDNDSFDKHLQNHKESTKVQFPDVLKEIKHDLELNDNDIDLSNRIMDKELVDTERTDDLYLSVMHYSSNSEDSVDDEESFMKKEIKKESYYDETENSNDSLEDKDYSSQGSDYSEELSDIDGDLEITNERSPKKDSKENKEERNLIEKIRCKVCLKEIKVKYFNTHMKNVHSSKATEATCDTCGKTLPNKNSLYQHINNVHKIDRKKIPCEICKRMICSYYMKKHIKFVHTDADKRHKCSICDAQVRNIKDHMRVTHREEIGRKTNCLYCDKTLPIRMIRKHIYNSHNDVKQPRIQCPICPTTMRVSSIYSHIKKIHDPDRGSKRVKCNICSKEFIDEWCLKKHTNEIHSDLASSHKCPNCEKVYKQKSTLMQHITALHSDEVPKHKCNICLRTFFRKSTLERHFKRLHSDRTKIPEEKVTCGTCGRQLSSKSHLRRHIRSVHENIKSPEVKCHICDAVLKSKSGLYHHINRRHLGLKETCNFCEKTYSSKWKLKVHINREHSGTLKVIHNDSSDSSSDDKVHVKEEPTESE